MVSPAPRFRHVRSLGELEAAAREIGLPAVLKTAGFGYDGKGQRLVRAMDELPGAWAAIGGAEAVLEQFIDFACELSVVAARDQEGRFAHFPVCLNTHERHILDLTLAPAPLEPRVAAQAVEIARGILESLDVVGVLCVEMFLARDGRLLVNELAPRPHNSGHYTFDACITSQFEQQLRAVVRPAARLDRADAARGHGQPARRLVGRRVSRSGIAQRSFPTSKIHLYGKSEARRGGRWAI